MGRSDRKYLSISERVPRVNPTLSTPPCAVLMWVIPGFVRLDDAGIAARALAERELAKRMLLNKEELFSKLIQQCARVEERANGPPTMGGHHTNN